MQAVRVQQNNSKWSGEEGILMHKTKLEKPRSIQGERFKVRYGLLLLKSERKISGTSNWHCYPDHVRSPHMVSFVGLQSTAQAVSIIKERRKTHNFQIS